MNNGSETVHRHSYNHKLDMTLRSTVTTRLRLYTLWLNPTNFMCTEFAQHTRGFSTTKEFATCNQQDATFHNLFISVRFSTCFRRFFCPSSETHNCTYSVRYLSEKYCYLLLAWQSLQFWASDDGRKTRLKHVEHLTEINKLRNVASCWLTATNILAMHGPMNGKNTTKQLPALC